MNICVYIFKGHFISQHGMMISIKAATTITSQKHNTYSYKHVMVTLLDLN